jgi:acyl CoA:acetate/3-ketoacid CoA transferase alpha subunit
MARIYSATCAICEKLADGRFIMTSGYGGVYIFDAEHEKIYRYGHDPLNVRSISANNTHMYLLTVKDMFTSLPDICRFKLF